MRRFRFLIKSKYIKESIEQNYVEKEETILRELYELQKFK